MTQVAQVGSPPGSIYSILQPYGGFYQPPQRRRPGTLRISERERSPEAWQL